MSPVSSSSQNYTRRASLISRPSHAELDGVKRSLTEPAVNDFARPKQPVTIKQYPARMDWIPSARVHSAAFRCLTTIPRRFA